MARKIRNKPALLAAAQAATGWNEFLGEFTIRPLDKALAEGDWSDQPRSYGNRGRLSHQDQAKLDRKAARDAKRAWQTA